MKSISKINKKIYDCPEGGDDQNINQFIETNKAKKIVAVQGIGFVGSATMVAVSMSDDLCCVGVDIASEANYWKIASINEGIFPIKSSDEMLEQEFTKAYNNKKILATHDEKIYEHADVILVDINLDVDKVISTKKMTYDVNLSNFKEAIRSIAKKCKNDVLVIIETTVPPGTTKNIVEPIFEEILKTRNLENRVQICHSYERVMPGKNYLNSIINSPRVISGINDTSAKEGKDFLCKFLNGNIKTLSNTNETEIAKVLENSYRAMNIAFIEEWSQFCENANSNLHEIIDVIKDRETHKNIMKPGLGVGGYCLTKDPLLASWSASNQFNSEKLDFSEKAIITNYFMPESTVKNILPNVQSRRNCLILGVSYLNDIGDTRNTPVQSLYELLENSFDNIEVVDPLVSYWEEKNLVINSLPSKKDYDLVILGTCHQNFRSDEFLKIILETNCELFYDCWGFLREYEHQFNNSKIVYKCRGIGT